MDTTNRSWTGVDSPQVCRLDAGPAAPSAARMFVREVASELPDETVERAALAVSELVTNSVLHGSPDAAKIIVRVTTGPAAIDLEVADAGGRSHRPREGGGLGLRVVDGAADEWSVHSKVGWLVRASFRPRPSDCGDR